MLGHRIQRWSYIKQTPALCSMPAGYSCGVDPTLLQRLYIDKGHVIHRETYVAHHLQ